MRKLYLLMFVLMAAKVAPAQSNLTLEQCIEYALKNNIQIQNAQLDEQSANAQVKEITGLGFPQVSGNVSVAHNNTLRRFFSAYSSQSPFFKDNPIAGVNEGDVVAAQNFFQLKSSAEAGLSINQLIFSGSYFVGLQAAKALKELTIKTTTQSQATIRESVTKAYYLVAVNEQRLTLFDNNIARLDTLLRNTTGLNEQGFVESIDVDRLKVTLNNLKTERSKFTGLKELAVELLKFQMNYPMEQSLAVVTDITVLDPTVDLNAYGTQWDLAARPEYQVMDMQRKLQTLNIKNNYALMLPNIGAFANLGYSTQSTNVGGLFKTDTNFGGNSNVGPDKWYPFSMFGVNLNVPLFTGLQRHYKIQQEKITLAKIDNGMKQLKAGFDLEIKQALTDYKNGLSSMESQKMNMALAANIARVAKIKYEQGVGSNLEVVEAESSLKESQINYYDALYQALVAKVSLDKAYGRLESKK